MNAVSPRLNPTLLQPKRSSKTARPLTPAAHTAPPFNPLGNGAGIGPPGKPAGAGVTRCCVPTAFHFCLTTVLPFATIHLSGPHGERPYSHLAIARRLVS